MSRGFIFSLEATISALIFTLILLNVFFIYENSSKEVIAIEKANDLLIIWSKELPSNSGMLTDLDFVFENNAEVYINGEIISKKIDKINSISTSGIIVNEFLNEREIKIIIYFD